MWRLPRGASYSEPLNRRSLRSLTQSFDMGRFDAEQTRVPNRTGHQFPGVSFALKYSVFYSESGKGDAVIRSKALGLL